MPVGPCRQRQLVVRFLYLTEIYRSRYSVDGIPKRLTGRYDFRIGPAGRGPVSLKLMGMPQRPGSSGADRQVLGVQILQGTARLGNDGLCIVLNDSQRGAHGGDTSNKVPGFVVRLGAVQGCFSSL